MRRGAVLEGYRALVAAAEAIEPRDRLKAIRILADAAISTFGAGDPNTMLGAAQRALELLHPDDPAAAPMARSTSTTAWPCFSGCRTTAPTRS
jgi:hypothetical protein